MISNVFLLHDQQCVSLTWFPFRKSLCFSYMTSLKVLSLHFLATAGNTLRKKASISSAFFFLRSDYISPGNPRSNLGPGTCLNSWLLTLGILQTYPLSESFMIDFLMPYIHRLIDQPPLNHNRQKLISCHCTSGSFQAKKSGPSLVWDFFPGPISCPGALTHCLLDFWKIRIFNKRTEPPGKKMVVQRRVVADQKGWLSLDRKYRTESDPSGQDAQLARLKRLQSPRNAQVGANPPEGGSAAPGR